MSRFLRAASVFLAAAALCAPAGAASPQDEPVAPVQVHGDNVEYFHEEQKVIGTGNVSIDYGDTRLTADKITVYMDTKNAVAEGNVVLKQPGGEFKGERGEYNFGNGSGKVDRMDMFLEPSLYGKAREVKKNADGSMTARDSYITTCCGDSPFYRVQARDIDIIPGKKVVVKNAVILVKGVPIFFLPLYVQPLVNAERFPFQIVPGRNSEWGPFLLSKTRYQLADRPGLKAHGNVLLDYRVKRGVAGGAEAFYKGDAVGRGAARVYVANDEDPPDDVSEGRYRAQLRHQMNLTPDTTLTAELNKLSDREIVKDFFFNEEYESNAFPDNYLSIITAKPEYSFSVLQRVQMNDFYTVVERSPELRFDTYNRAFADTPFYLRQEVTFTHLRKKFADSEDVNEATRFDTNHTLTYDYNIGDVSITPRVGTRQTFYSRTLEQEQHVRGTFDPGLDVSTRLFKTYDVNVRRFGLDYNGIRHIFRPSASWNYRPDPTVLRTNLQLFDAIDELDKRNFIRFNFENKLQTKEHSGPDKSLVTREIARVIPFFDMNYDTHRIDNVGLDVELQPYPWLYLHGDTTYDTVTRDFLTANADLGFVYGPMTFSVGQRYLRNESSQLAGEFKYRFSPDLEVRVYERYEFEYKESEEFEITVSKAFDCLIVDTTFNSSQEHGNSVFFVFRLKGYPKTSFSLSQSFNRPRTAAPEPYRA